MCPLLGIYPELGPQSPPRRACRCPVTVRGGPLVPRSDARLSLHDPAGDMPDGMMARSNGDLVAQARQMTLDVGRRPARVAEARAMLGLPARSEIAA